MHGSSVVGPADKQGLNGCEKVTVVLLTWFPSFVFAKRVIVLVP